MRLRGCCARAQPPNRLAVPVSRAGSVMSHGHDENAPTDPSHDGEGGGGVVVLVGAFPALVAQAIGTACTAAGSAGGTPAAGWDGSAGVRGGVTMAAGMFATAAAW